MRPNRQGGASGLMIVVVLVLLAVALLAARVLNRLGEFADDRATTLSNLQQVAAALEQYAAVNQRLPCPANPADSSGVEVPASAGQCTYGSNAHPEGSVPWSTLGLNTDKALDAWGRKISYKVYSGSNGSFTQPGGISMVQCDLSEPSPAGVTAVSHFDNTGGLCQSSTDAYQHNTTSAQFVAGKGLTLTDKTVNPNITYTDVAYVLISHGPTGMGGYTVSGVQLTPVPTSDERNNTRDDNFVSAPFSDPDIATTSNQHFDDFVFYRRITDLAARVGLAARDWPEGATFNSATLLAATGSSASGDTGRSSFSFMATDVTASGGNVSFTTTGGVEGIGVVGGSSLLISGTEFIHFDFHQNASRLGVSLANFGWEFSNAFREQVEFRFYDSGGSLIGSVTKQGCRADGGIATYFVDPPDPTMKYESVDVRPLALTNFSLISSQFLISEIASCTSALCDTTLSTGTGCTRAQLTKAFSPTTASDG